MAQKKSRRVGMAPGSVLFTGRRKVEKIIIHYLSYNATELTNQTLDNLTMNGVYSPVPGYIQWYDIRGLHDLELIHEIGRVFELHPLILEDVVNVHERPKLDEYDNGVFIQIKSMTFDKNTCCLQTEHVSIFLGDGFVLSFQEDEHDLFHKVRERIANPKGRYRKRKSDYLAYTLVDVIIMNLYDVLEQMEAAIQVLEDEILRTPKVGIKEQIHHLKQEMLLLRRQLIPIREVCNRFYESEHELIEDSTSFFIRDLNGHITLLIESVETYRDMLHGLQDLYHSVLSFQTNKVIQVLTIVSTIFIPLTFIVGIYGMNFDNLPELHYKYGYFIVMGFMFLLAILMLYYFKRKKWL
jgi:magnesium transporter